MKKNKKKKRGFRIGRVYDLLLIPAFILISFLFLMAIRSYTQKYLLIALVILVLILAISLLSFFYNKTFVEILRRILLTCICGILIFAQLKINSFDRFFSNLTNEEETPEVITTQMNVYSLADSDHFSAIVKTLDDIDGKTIGLQTSNDKDASNYVLEQIQKQYPNVKALEYSDYKSMLSDLYYGYVDSIAINADAIEGLESTFGPLADFTIQLKTYTYKKTVEIDYNSKDLTKETFSVLISGQDDVGTPNESSLSDVNMVAIINPISNQITMLSIPRDALVPNPEYNYANDKLTHTGWGGVTNTQKAIEATLQIDIDFYVKISFSSLIEIVDAIGGVDVNVPIAFEEQDENRSFENDDLIRLNAGEQTLNGKEALAFARHRHSYVNQDVGRTQAQLQIIKGIISKLISAEGVTSRIEKVLNIVPKYVLTNFSNAQLKSFIKNEIDELKPWNISSLSLANGYAPGEEGYIPVASSPEVNTSIYYLSRYDVLRANAVYQLMSENNHTFKQFNFDLSNLYEGLDTYDETKYDIQLAD
ncbi:MAG: hypothetical protein EOM50_05185 [Erysipelotrichia bacterium]|nr:hypothetical protein [Erysipelotrichia bacterium]NCC54500.1 hypothetical protein [Erysipelotrichia bacterium]